MSLRWERFAGDTAHFAMRLSFYDDPHPLRGADTDTSATWGAVQIWIDGVNICVHADQGETLTAAHWYMLPVLEWLVASWDPLLHEERLPLEHFTTAAEFSSSPTVSFGTNSYWEREERRFAWSQRHSLRASADGGLFPDLNIRRVRNEIEFSWSRTPIPGAQEIEWQAPSGQAYVGPDRVANALHEVLSSATDYLLEILPASPRLLKLQNAVIALRDVSATEDRVAWLAGLGTTAAEAVRRWRQILSQAKATGAARAVEASFSSFSKNGLVVTGSCQAALLFGSASPTLTDDDAMLLTSKLLEAYVESPSSGLDTLLRSEQLDVSVKPWAHGYELAEDLLEDVPDIVAESRVNIEAFLADHGVSIDDVDLHDEGLRAVSFAGDNHAPTILINKRRDGQKASGVRRFTLAHELCHLLFDREFGTQLAVASGPWAPLALEQRANAFAAMLLMPSTLLQEINSQTPFIHASSNDIYAAARSLGVSTPALTEHLYNVGLISDVQRTKLRKNDHS